MNNEIQRKITSLTLMTIMLAGSMIIAAPGMEPAYAANANLFVSAEKAEFVKYSKAELIQRLLPTIDTFEIALKNTKDDEKFVKGMEMVYAQLISLLHSEGLKPIESLGKKFDPYLHEVMLKEKSDKEDGIVLEELQKGYMLNDKVLRHSKVKVSEKIESDKKDKK